MTDRTSSRSRRAVLAGGATALASLAGCVGGADVVVEKRDEWTDRYDLTDGSLRVNADIGDVTVEPASADEVTVHVVKAGSLLASLDSATVETRRDGDTVVVEVTTAGGPIRNPPTVTINVALPAGVTVDALRSVNGDVKASNVTVADGTTVACENGDAVASNVDTSGRITVASDNGDARAEGVTGDVAAATTNGDVVVTDCDAVAGAKSVNGDVDVDVTAVRGDTSIETQNGDATAALAPSLDVHVRAKTDNGDVVLDDPPLTVGLKSETAVEGTIGDGTHELRVVSENGDVTLGRTA